MIQTDSILTPEEIQLCLVLGCLMEELAVLVEQDELLDASQNDLLIILP